MTIQAIKLKPAMPPKLRVERAKGEVDPGSHAYRPYGGAMELMYSKAPLVLLCGPRGTGKTRANLEKLHLAALKYPGMHGVISRKTRESLTGAALRTFEEKVLPVRSGISLHHEKQEYRYPNGSSIAVAGFSNDREGIPSKIFSTEYDMAMVNEALETTEQDIVSLLGCMRSGPMPYKQIIMDCNPGPEDHWLKRWCDEGKVEYIVSKHEDNPEVTPEYLAGLDLATGYMYKRHRLGLWCSAEGMFFEEWNPERHVVKNFKVPGEWSRWLAVDYGFADPFCCLWAARGSERLLTPGGYLSQIYLYRELYVKGIRDDEQARAIVQASSGERISRYIGDPSMFNRRREHQKGSIAMVYQGEGVPLQPGNNDRKAGWQTVRRALSYNDKQNELPRLQVMECCKNLIRTIPSQVVDPLDPEDMADSIRGQKQEDHPEDCLRYLLQAERTPDVERSIVKVVYR